VLLALIAAGVLAAAVSSLQLDRVGEALVSARPGWLAAALVLMMSSLLARSVSWRQVLRAAIPDVDIGRLLVARATMIGVLGSAVFPGRLGEPSRVIVVARRLPDSTRRMLAVVAGTVFSQTLINLLALAILAAITFTSVPLLQSKASALEVAVAAPLAIVALVLILPRLLRCATRSRSRRLRRGALTLTRLLRLARQGLTVFARPRHGAPAVLAQLLAWALQWSSCYLVLLALNLQSHDGLAAAAAVLLAVNVSAAVPATPSNVGVFQAVCIAVLAFYGVAYGPALAYGILLQAVEVLTALALGMPALLGEGMTWQDIRSAREQVTADAPPAAERPHGAAAPRVGAGARD
jgi:phosphatidyl-myo-inositol alpha-mannosyltransferase